MNKKIIKKCIIICLGILFIMGCSTNDNSIKDSNDEAVAKAKYDLLLAEAYSDVKDETKLKDRVTFDFSGFVDGVAFEGGSATGYVLALGSNQFIPGFEEQMVNHKINEPFDVTVTFPQDYQATNLAGKEAVFKILIHKIERYDPKTKFDDAFLLKIAPKYPELSNLKTVKEFEEYIIKNQANK